MYDTIESRQVNIWCQQETRYIFMTKIFRILKICVYKHIFSHTYIDVYIESNPHSISI